MGITEKYSSILLNWITLAIGSPSTIKLLKEADVCEERVMMEPNKIKSSERQISVEKGHLGDKTTSFQPPSFLSDVNQATTHIFLRSVNLSTTRYFLKGVNFATSHGFH